MAQHECEARYCRVVADEDEMVQGALGAWYCIPHWKQLLPSPAKLADALADAIHNAPQLRRDVGLQGVRNEGDSLFLDFPYRSYRLRVTIARPRKAKKPTPTRRSP